MNSNRPIRITWAGEKNRKLEVREPCPCGTCSGFDNRMAPGNRGYLTWSDSLGNGSTIFLYEQDFSNLKSYLLIHPNASPEDLIKELEKNTQIIDRNY